jgi:hypothetical protein
LPDFGQNPCLSSEKCYAVLQMERADLRLHVAQTFGVEPAAFDRLYEAFAAYFDVSLEEYVRRRHLELQKAGARNEAIYAALLAEARDMRFAERGLTERRIRRLIYG